MSRSGSGAFMKDEPSARQLAETMVRLGGDAGLSTVALLTDMSTPLGRTAGNALEVRESVEVLAGGGPADVIELTVALAREMLTAAGRDDHDPAEVLASGAAMDVWRAMISAQGGDPDAPLPGRPGERGGPRRDRRGDAVPGRDGRRAGRLAARRRPGSTRRCCAGRRRGGDARPPGDRVQRRCALAHACTATTRGGSTAGPRRPSTARTRSARAAPPRPLVLDRIA